jgi:hypothetical protein
VTFSDGTIGAFVVEELLELRPIRELAHEPPGAVIEWDRIASELKSKPD